MIRQIVCGVYYIIHRESGMTYVGQAHNVYTRWRDHCSALRRGNHGNPHLQSAFDKYGEGALDFEFRETVTMDQLTAAEQRHLDAIPSDLRYNMGQVVNSPMLGRTASPETRAKQSKAHMGHIASSDARAKQSAAQMGRIASYETKAKISAAHNGQIPWNKGHTTPTETRAKLSKANTGLTRSPKTRDNMSKAQMGRTVSPETRANMSKVRKGRPWSPARRAAYERNLGEK